MLRYLQKVKRVTFEKFQDMLYHPGALNPSPSAWQYVPYPVMEDFLLKFYNSKPSLGSCGISGLAVITGPRQSGKSTLLGMSLSQLQSQKENCKLGVRKQHDPQIWDSELQYAHVRHRDSLNFVNHFSCVVHYDLSTTPHIAFSAFISNLHGLIILRLLKLREQLLAECKQELLTSQLILQLLLYGKEPTLIDIYARDTLTLLLEDSIELQLQQSKRMEAARLAEQWKEASERGQQGIILVDRWDKLVDLVRGQSMSEVEAALLLGCHIMKSMELDLRPNPKHWHVSGIESTDFLMDVLTYVCGLHPLIADRMEEGKLRPLFVEQGQHVDCVVVLDSLQALYCEDREWYDWLDHMILSQCNSKGLRLRCPLIISGNNSMFLQKQVFEMGHLEQNSIEVVNPSLVTVLTFRDLLGPNFTKNENKAFQKYAGINISEWKKLYLKVHQTPELGLRESLARYQPSQAQHNQFMARLNSVYTSQRLLKALDDGSIDSVVLDLLQLLSFRNGALDVFQLYLQEMLVETPVVKAFIEADILYDYYYSDSVHLQKRTDIAPLRQAVRILKAELGLWGRAKHLGFRTWYGLPQQLTKYHMFYFKDRIHRYKLRRMKKNTLVRPYHIDSDAYNFAFKYQAEISATQLFDKTRDEPRVQDQYKTIL